MLAGIATGLVGAVFATRFLASLLYGVEPADPTTYALVAFALTAVGLAACIDPARRATELDPMTVLRGE